MLTDVARLLRRVVLPTLVLVASVAAAGLLATRVLHEWWPLEAESWVVRWFADHRSAGLDRASLAVSSLGSATAVTATTLLAALVLGPLERRWREAVFLTGSVALQAVALLATALLVDRRPPDVPTVQDPTMLLDFPSGHTTAAVALYGGVAVLVVGRLGWRGWRRAAVWAGLMVVPAVVGVSRLYRGTNHLGDILASLLIGLVCVAVMNRAVLSPTAVWGVPDMLRTAGEEDEEGAGGGPVAVVLNPSKLADPEAERRRISSAVAARGWGGRLLWLETTVRDPGVGMARQAVAAGARLVLACGGDGTVRSVASALAGTGVPMGIVPYGTGNLLARNLNLPIDVDDALHVALYGSDRWIDLGRARLDQGRVEHFAVMAGVGLDAAMVADAPDDLKRMVGWPAYVVSGARHLRDRRMRVLLRLDDRPPIRTRARAVLVGNVGRLQGGVELMPAAQPDDGLLEVVVIAPAGLWDWARVAGEVITRRRVRAVPRPGAGAGRGNGEAALQRYSARRVEIRTDRPEPCELDGDHMGSGEVLRLSVDAGAVRIRHKAI
ncbi:diacylglycerol kinase family protein [Allostreptomyces psammosilenae]|uniref:Diacylglycerol kinase family enzyme/membrane-associated phospholipid phosphatase n=1 Tax=Allostreptomyces psammosilenae TaxID=1892865 RepID=A0A853A4Q7_9ACTN|nr:diacylglycerol kinase family protein [Allostreptomyces psammosilenae]NYI05482.1 diacylglycerol kinase family enzyme/membrane-associated phospholipid phosphatase [Allostreptomyces psammosilenae]